MKSYNQGMSLIELMIALLTGLILLAGLISLFIETSANVRKTELVSAMHTEGQFALDFLAQDLAMAGFWGHTNDPASVGYEPSVLSVGASAACGPARTRSGITVPWPFDTAVPIEQVNDITASDAKLSQYTCVDTDELIEGTDVLIIRRTSGAGVRLDLLAPPTPAPGETAAPVVDEHSNAVYMRSNGAEGNLFVYNPAATPSKPDSPIYDWQYRPSLYFIRKYSRNSSDAIPTLCRKTLEVAAGAASFKGDSAGCIAEGIENLQLEFGIDTDGDGVANYYSADPVSAIDAGFDPLVDTDEMALTSSVRLYVLARSTGKHSRATQAETFELGSKTLGPFSDGFYREVFSTTLPVRNPARQRLMQ